MSDVYIDAARRMLTHGGYDILLMAQSIREDTALPSWVPDWRLSHRRTPNFPRGLDQDDQIGSCGPIYSALGVPQSSDYEILTLRGHFVDVSS